MRHPFADQPAPSRNSFELLKRRWKCPALFVISVQLKRNPTCPQLTHKRKITGDRPIRLAERNEPGERSNRKIPDQARYPADFPGSAITAANIRIPSK